MTYERRGKRAVIRRSSRTIEYRGNVVKLSREQKEFYDSLTRDQQWAYRDNVCVFGSNQDFLDLLNNQSDNGKSMLELLGSCLRLDYEHSRHPKVSQRTLQSEIYPAHKR